MIQYILECIAFQLVFLVIYGLLLKRETFFQWNRCYLIVTYTLSLILPWVKLEIFRTTVPQDYLYPEFLWNLDKPVLVTSGADNSGIMNLPSEYLVLIGGMLLATLLFGYKFFKIQQLRKNGQVHYFPNFTMVVIANSELAFSFFKSIFLGDKILKKDREKYHPARAGPYRTATYARSAIF